MKNRFLAYGKSTKNRFFSACLCWYGKAIIFIFLIAKRVVQSEGPGEEKSRLQLSRLGKLKSTKNRFRDYGKSTKNRFFSARPGQYGSAIKKFEMIVFCIESRPVSLQMSLRFVDQAQFKNVSQQVNICWKGRLCHFQRAFFSNM